MADDPNAMLAVNPAAAQYQEQERRQKLLQALLGSQQNQVPPQFYGPANALAQVAQTLALGLGEKKLGESRTAARTEFQTGRKGAFENWNKARMGYDPQKPESVSAVVDALAGLDQYGAGDFGRSDYERLVPATKDMWKPVTDPNLPSGLQQSGAGKLDPIGHAPGTVINTGEREGNKQLAKDTGAQLTESAQGVRKAVGAIAPIDEAIRTLAKGTKGGVVADPAMVVSKIGTALGFGDDQVANTEFYNSLISEVILPQTKALGAGSGFSNVDLAFLEKAKGSKSSLDNASKLKILNMARVLLHNSGQRHNAYVKQAQKVEGFEQADLAYGVPVPPIPSDDPYVTIDPRTGMASINHKNLPGTAATGAVPPPGPMVIEYDAQGNRIQ